jgi:isopentenyl-diphosphate Delta-isomerase
MADIADRKEPPAEGFDAVRFVHEALPDLDFGKIDLGTDFLGRRLKAPLLIAVPSGGHEAVDARLAEAAQHLGIGLAVRATAGQPLTEAEPGPGMALRLKAPDTPILASVGAARLTQGLGVDEARRMLDVVAADALVVELNPLLEACRTDGDRDWWGVGAALERLVRALDAPVAVRASGGGLSSATARRLAEMGVAALEVAGTDAPQPSEPDGEAFGDWGLTTAQAIAEVRAACPRMTLIGSGGVRDGVDAARAIRLGADMVGFEAGVMSAAATSTEAVVAHVQAMTRQLRTVCFCTGSANLTALRAAPIRG